MALFSSFSLFFRSLRIARAERAFVAARRALNERASIDAMARFAEASRALYCAVYGGYISEGAPNISRAMRASIGAR